MQISKLVLCCAALVASASASAAVGSNGAVAEDEHHPKGHHHHHHHKGHHHGKHKKAAKAVESAATPAATPVVHAASHAAAVEKVVATPQVNASARDEHLVAKMKALEQHLAEKQRQQRQAALAMREGHLLVNGPVPADFSERFAQAVAQATGVDARRVMMTSHAPMVGQPGIVSVDFKAPPKIVADVENQSADPESKLAKGNLHSFLVAKEETEEREEKEEPKPPKRPSPRPVAAAAHEATPVEEKGIDIDTQMPYGDLEPFGREDTAQELTENSVKESDEMVDQLERAEVAEEKRAVFRALTRLRGAAITSFDGVARSQTGNIDEYNKVHKWRKTHPLHHLANEESDVSKWAFPDNADF